MTSRRDSEWFLWHWHSTLALLTPLAVQHRCLLYIWESLAMRMAVKVERLGSDVIHAAKAWAKRPRAIHIHSGG
jgi:hypothetical protein